LDEAQDINPVTSAFVLAQAKRHGPREPVSILLVGDSHQQIYSFRGAKDTLKKIKTSKTLYLTQSFRFDNNIARVANMVLRTFKNEKNKIVGTPVNRQLKPNWDPGKHTIIARTNAGVFDQAAKLSNKKKIGFMGGVEGYRLNTIKDVYHLYANSHGRIFDRYIKRFKSYRALKSYAETVEDFELLSVCKVVETYQYSIPQLVDTIKATAVATDKADIILTTAHKSKGLEWENVLMLDDFATLVADDKLIDPSELEPDEFNLIYVAITRTIYNLRFHKRSSMSAFIRLVQQQTKSKSAGRSM
jgi:F-box protein, helicase, 18